MAEPDVTSLTKVLNKLEQVAGEYWNDLFGNELLTRYVLIDPVVRALGWNTEDPTKVRVNYKIDSKNKRADYALFGSKGIVALIEAKPCGTFKNDGVPSAIYQAAKYRKSSKVPLGIVTDGLIWYTYNLCKRGPYGGRKMVEFWIDAEKSSEKELIKNAREALRLSSNRIASLARKALESGG